MPRRRPTRRWRGCAGGPVRRSRSREQAFAAPGFAVALKDQPVVQARRLVLPELDSARDEPETGPEIRPQDGAAVGETAGEHLDPAFELLAAVEQARLVGRPGGDLAAARPACEIGV